MPIIDVHAHVATPGADELIVGRPEFVAQLAAEAASQGPASSAYNRQQIVALMPALTEVGPRLAAMDAGGVEVQTVSATPVARHWLDLQLANRWIGAVNEAVAEHCAQAPDRLVPIASVTLHHPAAAVEQLRAAVLDLGAVGVQISTSAGPGVELDDPSLDRFWNAAIDLDVPVLIHPWGCSLAERLNVGYLFNHVGNPTETSVALARLIFGGTLDRCPELRIWGAHGGGWLPSYSGRADHAWRAREDARTCAHEPSAYLRRMWFDALVYTPDALRFLVRSVGADHVTVGTDYPFDMGVTDPVARIGDAIDDPAMRDAILSGSALELFGGRLARRLESEEHR